MYLFKAAVEKSFEGGHITYTQDGFTSININIGNFGGDFNLKILPMELFLESAVQISPLNLRITGSYAETTGKFMVNTDEFENGAFELIIGDSLEITGQLTATDNSLLMKLPSGEYGLTFSSYQPAFQLIVRNPEMLGTHELELQEIRKNPDQFKVSYEGDIPGDFYQVRKFETEFSSSRIFSTTLNGRVLGESVTFQQKKDAAELKFGDNVLAASYPEGNYKIMTQIPSSDVDMKLKLTIPAVEELELEFSGKMFGMGSSFILSVPKGEIHASVENAFNFIANMRDESGLMTTELTLIDGSYNFATNADLEKLIIKMSAENKSIERFVFVFANNGGCKCKFSFILNSQAVGRDS